MSRFSSDHSPFAAFNWRSLALIIGLAASSALGYACGADGDNTLAELDPNYDPDMNEDWVGASLRKGQPGARNGMTDYCRDPANRCDVGEGNCVSNSNCLPGLVCAALEGGRWRLPGQHSVCVPAQCDNNIKDEGEDGIDCGGPCGSCSKLTSIRNGSHLKCSTLFPCEAGEGSCAGSFRPCAAGLTCAQNVGADFGLPATADVCVAGHCSNGQDDGDETGVDCGGSCKPCARPASLGSNGGWKYCTSKFKCGNLEGHCENNNECESGLTCTRGLGKDYGFASGVSLCLSPCVPESNEDFCAANGAECGSFEGLDNCDNIRDVDCGGCTGGASCNGNLCECAPESDSAFCARKGSECGTTSGLDNCGDSRSVNCGSCGVFAECSDDNACEDLPDPRRIGAGTDFTCGAKSDGTLECWGSNTSNRATPPSGAHRAVTAGSLHACAIRENRTVACWGSSAGGRTTPAPGTYTRISAYSTHTCGVRENGTAACWGSNSFGQSTVPSGEEFSDIAAGSNHTCGVLTGGEVLCWGTNGSGQTNAPVTGTYTAIAAGNLHSCAIKTDGTVTCWGNVSTAPTGTFTRITAGGAFSCGIKTNGTIACWGSNTTALAGVPSGTFTDIESGPSHTCALRTNGSLACWGLNTAAQATPPAGTF